MLKNILIVFKEKDLISRINLIIILHTLSLFIGTISNYKTSYLSLKIVLVASVLIILLRSQFFKQSKFIFDKNIKVIFLILLTYPLFTLSYSVNFDYGLIKLFHFYVGIIGNILSTYLIFKLIPKSELIKSLELLLYLAVPFAVAVILLTPFQYDIAYGFEITRWSHVFSGRFLSYILLISLFFFFERSGKSFAIIYLIILAGLISTGFRAGIIAGIVLTFFSVLYKIYRKEIIINGILLLKLMTGFSAFITVVFLLQPTVLNRLVNIFGIFSNDIDMGGAISVRLDSYLVSLKIFLKHPILGVGFGGFNFPWFGYEFPIFIKYPHNLILEVLVEFGLMGVLVWGFIFYKLFRSAYFYSFEVFVLVLLSFFLAMFSKDIATNALLLIGFNLLNKPRNNN